MRSYWISWGEYDEERNPRWRYYHEQFAASNYARAVRKLRKWKGLQIVIR